MRYAYEVEIAAIQYLATKNFYTGGVYLSNDKFTWRPGDVTIYRRKMPPPEERVPEDRPIEEKPAPGTKPPIE